MKTDVILLFDTTGSMAGAIDEAQAQIGTVMDRLSATLPDAQFALASVRDYGSPVDSAGTEYGDAGDVPFTLVQPMTADRSAMRSAIGSLSAIHGGDDAEAYGRALYEADVNKSIGWRPGARRVAVMVADDMPHDANLNEDIPPSVQIRSSPYDTGADPGPDGRTGTGDDIDWQGGLAALNLHGLPLMYVLYHGDESRLAYWRIWAQSTGGDAVNAVDASSSSLADQIVAVAQKGATATLPACPGAGQDRGTDGACRAMPVIFVPGIMGSEIWCGDRKLWFNYRLGTGINHKQMLLASDGVSPRNPSDTCNAGAGPKPGQILRSGGVGGLQQDAYGTMADFLGTRYPGRTYLYAYDWRKAPAAAVAGLDATIEQARNDNGGVRALVVAHSMGGLVTQELIGDPSRAAKVARVVTIGTPYWGSPKSILPLARGDTEISPWPGLDTLLDNGEIRDLASNMAGLYSLFPSESWHKYVGNWLTIREQSKNEIDGADATAVAISKTWKQTNLKLYRQGLAEHHQIDGWRTNGVPWLAIVGAGKATVGKVNYDDDLFRDDWDMTWINGDQTVPLLSAAQGSPTSPPLGDAVARLYACNVGHSKETADPGVQGAAAGFLDTGTVAGLDQQPCASDKEDQIDLRLQPKKSKASTAAAAGRSKVTVSFGGKTLSLAEAELTGAVSVYGDPEDGRVTIVAAHGSKVTTSGRDVTAAVSSISGTAKSPTKRFGPVDGSLTVTAGPTATATHAGRRLKTSHRDRSAPKVSAHLRRKGRSATLTLKASDGSGVRAIAVRYAKVVRLEHGALVVVRFAKLPRAGRLVRWQATDAFGNASRVRSIRIKPVTRP